MEDRTERQRWMAVLAKAEAGAIATRLDALDALGALPPHRRLRGPETGLVMVRGRQGSDGAPFNLGEMTVTRCAVQLEDGTVGHAYVGGRDGQHAELAALADALLQDAVRHDSIQAAVIAPLAAEQAEAAARDARRAAATKVDFLTMVTTR
jgi:alpha-D-ribose 1-methylphosphonate 5-triphosphate synthase subunit PhnG